MRIFHYITRMESGTSCTVSNGVTIGQAARIIIDLCDYFHLLEMIILILQSKVT
jgi:hypothetical protein